VDRIARAFHERYEALASRYGYETRPESAVTWENVPEQNKNLMCAVVASLLIDGVIAEPGKGSS
jgi:hypothetical protein